MTIYIETPIIRERGDVKTPMFAVTDSLGAAVNIIDATIIYIVMDA